MTHHVLGAAGCVRATQPPSGVAYRAGGASTSGLHPLHPLHRLPRRRGGAAPRAAADPPPAEPPAEPAGGDDLPIERQRAARRREPKAEAEGFGAAPAGGGGGPKVVAPAVERAYGGGPLTPAQKAEGFAVSALGLVFAAIIAEGIFLAASGFMSEDMDRLAQAVVYPAFSPTVGLFLAGSTAYGLWKTRGGPDPE